MRAEIFGDTLKDREYEFTICAKEYEKECIKEDLQRLGREIHTHEKRGEHLQVALLLNNVKTLMESLKLLS
jgi:hypothetical protein